MVEAILSKNIISIAENLLNKKTALNKFSTSLLEYQGEALNVPTIP